MAANGRASYRSARSWIVPRCASRPTWDERAQRRFGEFCDARRRGFRRALHARNRDGRAPRDDCCLGCRNRQQNLMPPRICSGQSPCSLKDCSSRLRWFGSRWSRRATAARPSDTCSTALDSSCPVRKACGRWHRMEFFTFPGAAPQRSRRNDQLRGRRDRPGNHNAGRRSKSPPPFTKNSLRVLQIREQPVVPARPSL